MFAGTYWLSGRWLMLVGVPYNTKRSRIARSVLGVAVVVLCGIWRVVVIVVMHVIAFALLCEIAAVIARRIGKRFKGKRVYSVLSRDLSQRRRSVAFNRRAHALRHGQYVAYRQNRLHSHVCETCG